MATTHDWRTGTYANDPQGRGNFNSVHEGLDGQPFTMLRYIDTTVTPLTSGDTYKLFTVEAGCLVKGISCFIATVEGETGTMQIGDDDADEFVAALDMEVAGMGTITLAYKYYAANNYIGITPNHALEDCKFYIFMDVIRLA
jgi:hypothetical protein